MKNKEEIRIVIIKIMITIGVIINSLLILGAFLMDTFAGITALVSAMLIISFGYFLFKEEFK